MKKLSNTQAELKRKRVFEKIQLYRHFQIEFLGSFKTTHLILLKTLCNTKWLIFNFNFLKEI